MASSWHNVELEAAKFLQKLIQESKDDPSKLATKLYVILQHMESSGKEHSMPFQVISRAMETVISQNGLDIEVLKSSRLSTNSSAQTGDSTMPNAAYSSVKMVNPVKKARLHKLLEEKKANRRAQAAGTCQQRVAPATLIVSSPSGVYKRKTTDRHDDQLGSLQATGTEIAGSELLLSFTRGRTQTRGGLSLGQREDAIMDHFGSIYEHFKKTRTEMEQAESSRIDELAAKDERISSLKSQLQAAQVSVERLKSTLKAKDAEIERAEISAREAQYKKDNETLEQMWDGFDNCLNQVRKLAPDLPLNGLELDLSLLPVDPEVLLEVAATDVLPPSVHCSDAITLLALLAVSPPPVLFTEVIEGGGES